MYVAYVCTFDYVPMYVYFFDFSHTGQPIALKLWNNIPYVTILKHFSQILEKESYCPFSIFIQDFSVNLKSDFRKNKKEIEVLLLLFWI